MRFRKHGLALLVAALGLLAFSASAQALTPGFLVAKQPVGVKLLPTIGAEQVGTGTLLIPDLNLEVDCGGFTVEEGSVINSNTDAFGKLLFTGCAAATIGPPLEALTTCTIVLNDEVDSGPNHIAATGLILPTELIDKNEKGELEPALLIEKIVAKIIFAKGLGCPIALLTTVKGELCVKIDNNDTVEPTLLLSESIQTLCKLKKVLEELPKENEEGTVKDLLLYGIHDAHIKATAKVFLTGKEHKGLTLGVSLF